MITAKWETINTAPKNGDLFILYINEPDAGFVVGTATFIKGELTWLDNENQVTLDSNNLYLWTKIPTSI